MSRRFRRNFLEELEPAFEDPDSQRSRQLVQVVRFVGLLDFIGLLLGAVADVNATAHDGQNDQQNENQKTHQELDQHAAALRGGWAAGWGDGRRTEVEAGRQVGPEAWARLPRRMRPGERRICRRSCLRRPAIRIVRKTA